MQAESRRFRCMWRDDPATTMVIGWEQVSGENPTLHYDVIDFGAQAVAYRNKKRPDRIIFSKGMHNHFVRLSGLSPNTVYYFVIKDSKDVSQRMSFKTAPGNPNTRLSIIAGGDSRNNREVRRNANRLVSKLRPHFVVFAGDMTGGDTNENWRNWFDDWQETIGSDGRLFPIVPARGNHERENGSITELFDVSSSDVYYALTFGGKLLRLYTLNTLISASGRQRTWLEEDLKANQNVIWKMAQYHHGMRPHTRVKAPRGDVYANWANLFFDYDVKLVLESDAHVVKTTYPIRPKPTGNNDEGFVREEDGTVYIGEGCWGAPLRPNNSNKSWTRASGSFNQFKWIFVSPREIEVRTIKTEGVHRVAEVSQDNIFEPPVGLVIWKPQSGDVLTIRNERYQPPVSKPQRPPYDGHVQAPSKPQPKPKKKVDRNDWSAFPAVEPNADGVATIRYRMPRAGEVTIKLINRDWKMVTDVKLPDEPPGRAVKNLNLKDISRGEYLLVIKADGKLLQRFRVVKR